MGYPVMPEGAHDLAVLDLGSNSLRMNVIRVDADRTASVLACYKRMVRLGEGAFESGSLQAGPMRRTLDALEEFAEHCRARGVERHAAYATSAMRDAANGTEFAEEIRRRTGFGFRIISGEEEARLIGLGVSSSMPSLEGSRMIVDVGGGSTEIVVMQERRALEAVSLKAGAVRMAEMLPGGTGPVPRDTYESLKARIRSDAEDVLKRMLRHGPVEMVGSSGSARCLTRMEQAFRGSEEGPGGAGLLTLAGLRKAAEALCGLDEASRAALPGMNAKRSGIIIPGAAILEVLMEESGFSAMRFSEKGLREGIVADYLGNCR